MDQTIIAIVTAVALGASLLLAGVASWQLMKARESKAIGLEKTIEDWALPHIYQAIFAGEHIALNAMQDLQVALSALDRKAIADNIYDCLPQRIGPFPIVVFKTAVPRARFGELVEQVYREALSVVTANEEYLTHAVDALNVPTSPKNQ